MTLFRVDWQELDRQYYYQGNVYVIQEPFIVDIGEKIKNKCN